MGLLCKLAFTLGAFWLVFRGVDVAQLTVMIQQQNHGLLIVSCLLIGLQIVLGALRWHLIVTALSRNGLVNLSAAQAFQFNYISVFFNCCLPSGVGADVVRVWLAKKAQLPLTTAIHSVIIDRIIALAALGILLVMTLPALGSIIGFHSGLSMALVMAGGVLSIWLFMHTERLLRRHQQVAAIRGLLHFADSIRLLGVHKKAAVVSIFYAIMSHVSYFICAYVLALSLSIDITLWQCIVLMPLVILAITLPISIGGWGIREAGMVGMLGLIGIPQAYALLLSIQLGLITILVSLPAGVWWLVHRKA